VGATGIAILALVIPLLCLAAIVVLLYWATKKAGRLLFGRNRGTEVSQP
jgi:flagellar biosynthesis/type III secretory pathway M-ring protein FliF/YscJ